MSKKSYHTIGELLATHLKKEGGEELVKKYDEGRALNAWSEVLGPTIASYTTSLRMESGTLYVKISSSVLRHELFMQRHTLLSKLNEHLGKKIIFSIHFN